jgi:hypothetical protein
LMWLRKAQGATVRPPCCANRQRRASPKIERQRGSIATSRVHPKRLELLSRAPPLEGHTQPFVDDEMVKLRRRAPIESVRADRALWDLRQALIPSDVELLKYLLVWCLHVLTVAPAHTKTQPLRSRVAAHTAACKNLTTVRDMLTTSVTNRNFGS